MTESEYMDALEDIMTNFRDMQIQADIRDRNGSTDADPFAEKYGYALDCRVASGKVDGCAGIDDIIRQLQDKISRIANMEPPPEYKDFHARFDSGMKLHVEAYQELRKAFEDGDREHVTRGQAMVEKALDVMEGKT